MSLTINIEHKYQKKLGQLFLVSFFFITRKENTLLRISLINLMLSLSSIIIIIIYYLGPKPFWWLICSWHNVLHKSEIVFIFLNIFVQIFSNFLSIVNNCFEPHCYNKKYVMFNNYFSVKCCAILIYVVMPNTIKYVFMFNVQIFVGLFSRLIGKQFSYSPKMTYEPTNHIRVKMR